MASEGTTASQGDKISGSVYSQEEIDAILFPPDTGKAFRSDTAIDRLREIE